MNRMKGLRSTGSSLQNSHGDEECRIGNIVIDIVRTVYGARWVLKYQGDHFVKHMIV